MNQDHPLVQSPVTIEPGRLRRLQVDLRHAWNQTSRSDLQAWGLTIGKDFAWTSVRRVKNVGKLIYRLGQGVIEEAQKAAKAIHAERFKEHVAERATAASRQVQDSYVKATDFISEFAQAFRRNPQEAGIQFATLVLTSLLVSGGPDGDGGAPDLDLAFGIDAHRSILSHSILMGAALETGILSLLKLVQLTHSKLPERHDPIWDALHAHASDIALAASQGASIGMAYHLLVDGLAQPAPYHDLPVPMPLEAHQAILVVNGAGEIADVTNKRESAPQAHSINQSLRGPSPA